MATLTATGIEVTSLADAIRLYQAAFRNALGRDLDVAAESPQGQIIAALALVLTQASEGVTAVGNGLAPSRAIGAQLDDLLELLNLERAQAARSTVGVRLTGTAGTVVPQHSRARTDAGAMFRLTAAATIGPAGHVDAVMESVDEGAVEAAAGALTSIVDLVAGWTGVTNAASASPGRLVETDVAFWARSQRLLSRNARSSDEAIVAAVREVEGVVAAAIHENVTNAAVTRQTIQIAARSFLVIVQGGTNADVAAAIANSKPVGVVMSGAVAVNVPRTGGASSTPIKFTRVSEVPLTVEINTTVRPGFPGDGAEQIVQRVAGWAAGTWRSGTGDFDVSGLGIGEAFDANRLYSPIQSVPGHQITSVTIERKSDMSAVGAVALNERLTIAAADVTVNVS